MDIFHTGDFFWMLALAIPILVVLLVLCTDCRDPDLDTPAIDDYQYKPSTNIHSQTFRVLRRPPSPPWSAILSQPDLQSTDSAYSLCSQTPAFIRTEDNESVPSYENEGFVFPEPPFVPDDDDNYIPGYIVVLPDVPITEQRKKDHASSESIMDQYENVPESQRHSLGEYVNVLEPAPIILDPCFGVGTSDRESEDDVPDYENVCFGL